MILNDRIRHCRLIHRITLSAQAAKQMVVVLSIGNSRLNNRITCRLKEQSRWSTDPPYYLSFEGAKQMVVRSSNEDGRLTHRMTCRWKEQC